MEIPAVYAMRSRRGMFAALPEGCLPPDRPAVVPFAEVAAGLRGAEREPAVVVDWDSLRSSKFREGVVKGMKVRGRDVWFLTWIRDVGDLMDSFNTTAAMVLAPIHSLNCHGDLEDILMVSDSTIPTIFCEKGKALVRGGTADILEALDDIERTGFPSSCVLDADGGLTGSAWDEILESFPSCIPFTCEPWKVAIADRRIVPLRPRRAP